MEEIAAEVPFQEFGKIHRLKRGCLITEKIDGSNGQVCIGEDGSIRAGSRNRWLTPHAISGSKATDNMGFAAWVESNKAELATMGPGRHYGEWWGVGIQAGYDIHERRFSLFNVKRWGDEPFRDAKYTGPRPACCGVVPVLYEGDFSTDAVDDALAYLQHHGSQVAPGFMKPEGVVVYMLASGHSYKVTLGGDGHKGTEGFRRAG